MISVSINYLGMTFSSEAEFEKALAELHFLTKMPSKCPHCNSELEFFFEERTAKSGKNAGKKFIYYGIQCKGSRIRHSANISKYKDGGYFFKNEWSFYDKVQKIHGEIKNDFTELPTDNVAENTSPNKKVPKTESEIRASHKDLLEVAAQWAVDNGYIPDTKTAQREIWVIHNAYCKFRGRDCNWQEFKKHWLKYAAMYKAGKIPELSGVRFEPAPIDTSVGITEQVGKPKDLVFVVSPDIVPF